MSKAYYDRKLPNDLICLIKTNYPWLVDYVINHRELDFQTVSNASKSWFQVYRGTGRLFRIDQAGIISADPAYIARCPEFYTNPTPELLTTLLDRINNDSKFDKYYCNPEQTLKKEGYYQNLISRRYTFFTKPEDEFIIIDKELVIGFVDKLSEEEWNRPIIQDLEQCLNTVRENNISTRLPKTIKSKYGEFDFLGLTWSGNIIIMELKEKDPTKTYLSPIQIGYYNRQFKKLLSEIPDIYNGIKQMIQQKIDLNILHIPEGKSLPDKLSGIIENYLIVGDDSPLSPEICRRFRLFRANFLPNLKAYSCTGDGTLVLSKKLENS